MTAELLRRREPQRLTCGNVALADGIGSLSAYAACVLLPGGGAGCAANLLGRDHVRACDGHGRLAPYLPTSPAMYRLRVARPPGLALGYRAPERLWLGYLRPKDR